MHDLCANFGFSLIAASAPSSYPGIRTDRRLKRALWWRAARRTAWPRRGCPLHSDLAPILSKRD